MSLFNKPAAPLSTASLAMVLAGLSLPSRAQDSFPPVVPRNGDAASQSMVISKSGFQKVEFDYGTGKLTFEIPAGMKETLKLKRAKWWKDAEKETDLTLFSALLAKGNKLEDIRKGFLPKTVLMLVKENMTYPLGKKAQADKGTAQSIPAQQASFFAPEPEFLDSLPAETIEILGPAVGLKPSAVPAARAQALESDLQPRGRMAPQRVRVPEVTRPNAFNGIIVGSCSYRVVQVVLVPEGDKERMFALVGKLDVTPFPTMPRPGAKLSQLAAMEIKVSDFRDDFGKLAESFSRAVAGIIDPK